MRARVAELEALLAAGSAMPTPAAALDDDGAALAPAHDFERLFMLSLDLMCVADTAGTFVRVNPAFERTLGYTAAELVAVPFVMFVHPEDRDRTLQELAKLRTGVDTLSFENRYRCKNGSYRWLSWVCPAARRGERKIYAVARDVTEQRRVHHLVDRLFQVSPVLLSVVDLNGFFLRLSKAWEKALGFPDTEMINRHFLDFVHPDDRERTLQHVQQSRERSEQSPREREISTSQIENRYITRDGGFRWLRWSAVISRDDNLVFAAAHDFTEERAAAEAARRREMELAHLSRRITVGEMATTLAHELNQPLAAIGNFAAGSVHRLRAGGSKATGEVLQAMERIVAETTRAAAIIRHLRHMVRKEEPEERCVNLDDLIRRMLELLEPETVQHRIRVITNLEPRVPAVRAVEVQIEQVILNLLRNSVDAIVASDRGERIITVSTVESGPSPGPGAGAGDHEVQVIVADTGIGIRPDDMPRLFEPFFTTKPDGLGMGLRISQSIVEAHGGRLTATAIPEGGASFTMRLPAALRGEG